MFDLDVRNTAQVAGHQVIEADLGIGGKRLLIASGIALPQWILDSDEVHRREARVNLRVPADRVIDSSVSIGLASIGNRDTAYLFAIDSAKIEVSAEGELTLLAQLALLGEPSSLNRFSYQVVAVISRASSEITGTIWWARSVWEPPDRLPSTVAARLDITANFRTTKPLSGGFGGINETLVPAVAGEVLKVDFVGEQVVATYRIANPPLNRELKVTCANTFPKPAGGQFVISPLVTSVPVFTLGSSNPSRSSVDFAGSIVKDPR